MVNWITETGAFWFQLLHILFWKGWSPWIIELIWLIDMIFYWYWKHTNLH